MSTASGLRASATAHRSPPCRVCAARLPMCNFCYRKWFSIAGFAGVSGDGLVRRRKDCPSVLLSPHFWLPPLAMPDRKPRILKSTTGTDSRRREVRATCSGFPRFRPLYPLRFTLWAYLVNFFEELQHRPCVEFALQPERCPVRLFSRLLALP